MKVESTPIPRPQTGVWQKLDEKVRLVVARIARNDKKGVIIK